MKVDKRHTAQYERQKMRHKFSIQSIVA